MIVICDIDGTAANINHRRHYVEDKSKGVDWDAFFEAMVDDTPNAWCKVALSALTNYDIRVHFVTGRPEKYREQTTAWLHYHYSESFLGRLYMRPEGSRAPDYQVKEAIYEQHFAKSKDDILFVIDDRQQVVDMWRSKGLTVLQCDKGDF